MNKVFKIVFLNALFISSLFSSSSIYNQIEKTKLYKSEYWSKLLHYRNNVSEVDSDNFFISKEGRVNLKKELFETTKSLINGTNKVLCRFPLRVKWLKEKIPQLSNEIKTYQCKNLDLYLKEINANYATLVFPASHINSPASMYGHTFLRISGDKETPLLGNAVNYAAQTEETNGFIFAYKGIFGGYKGKYSILPYYKKIKEYNNLEQRDIWEYDLNLTKEEVLKIALHSYELQDSYSFYFFFLENCSYNLLWLLEIAREDLDLVSKFDLKAVPLDTIKVLKEYDLIKSSNFRYSKVSRMKHILENEIKNKKHISAYIKEDKELHRSLDINDKVAYMDLKIAYLQYKRSNNKVSEKVYIKKYLKLLKQRSKLDKVSKYKIEKPLNPLYSHDSARLKLTYKNNDSFELGLKPVYSNKYDISDGYLQGAYIDFFDLNLLYDKNKLEVQKFKILDIKSYSKRDLLFKPISWGVEASYERFNDDEYFKLKPEFGLTYGYKKTLLSFMINSNLYNKVGDNLLSLGSEVNLISNDLKDTKIGLSYSYDKYNKGFENKIFEVFTTYKINNNLALNIKYKNDGLERKRDITSFSFFYYF